MFSNSCKYGIRAVLYLAVHSSETEKLRIEEMANKLDIPRSFLAKIMQKLTKNNIVSAVKGRNGGFYLTEENKNSYLISVIEIIDGTGSLTNCILGLESCSPNNQCPYHSTVSVFRRTFIRQLQSETIEEIAQRINLENFELKSL